MVIVNQVIGVFNGMLNPQQKKQKQIQQQIDLMFKYMQSKAAINLPEELKQDMLLFFEQFKFNKKFMNHISKEQRSQTILYKILDFFVRVINADIVFLGSEQSFLWTLKSWSRFVDEGHGNPPDNELTQLIHILNDSDDSEFILSISKFDIDDYKQNIQFELINFIRSFTRFNLITFDVINEQFANYAM